MTGPLFVVDETQTLRGTLDTFLVGVFQIRYYSPQHALQMLRQEKPKACLVHLEKLVHLKQWASEARKIQELVPIFVLSKDVNPRTLEFVFDSGGDSVLSLPLDFSELYWSLRFLIRVSEREATRPEVHFSDSSFNTQTRILTTNGVAIPLSRVQTRLLETFLQYPNQVLDRRKIRQSVWNSLDIADRSIDAQISKLKKLSPDLSAHISTLYGKGYYWSSEIQKARKEESS